MKIVIFILVFLISSLSLALPRGKLRGVTGSTKIGATLMNFTGPEHTSFSEGSPAYGVEFSVDGGSGQLKYFYRARINSANGLQEFIKSSTTFTSEYEFFSVEPELGFTIYPVQRGDSGVNIYFWGTGNISYNYLEIKTIPSSVTIDPKSQALGYGFGGGIGLELVYDTSNDGKRLMIYSEVGFRQGTAPLAGQVDFEVGGLVASVGFGF